MVVVVPPCHPYDPKLMAVPPCEAYAPAKTVNTVTSQLYGRR